ncbi:MAG: hypothetical protein LBG12_10650, partial [Synergistaceae bacterium]|nr:hypothetical protein [Synergistaceae bacterium]
MFNIRKIKIFCALFTLLFLLFLCGYYILSGCTFLADVVAQRVEETFKRAGGVGITWESVAGNPITGVVMSGVKIYASDSEIASLGEFRLRFSLKTIASSQPKVSKIVITKMVSDFETLSALPLAADAPSEAGWSGEMALVDSAIDTKWGNVFLSDANFSSNAGGFAVRLRGKFRDIAISADGKGDMSGGIVKLEKLSATFGNMRIYTAGKLMPSLAMNC